MKELCVDGRMLFSSGIGTYLQAILPYFLQHFGSVRLLVEEKMPFERLPWLAQADLIVLSASIYSLKEQWLLPRKIPRADLFFSPHYNIPLGAIKARRRMVTIHDFNHLALPHLLSWPEKCYAKYMLKQALLRSHVVVTVSQFSQQEAKRFFGVLAQKMEVVPLGVDRQRFFPQSIPHDQEVQRRYQLPKRYLLFVGNLKPHKNLRALLLALQAVEEISLVVIGKKGGLRHRESPSEQFVLHSSLCQRVHFFEAISAADLPSFYRGAFATIVPSLYEGFGLPALEAMASGSPVAVSNVASLPEVCLTAVLYFHPERPHEIAAALQRLLLDAPLRTHLIAQGIERASAFSWSRCAQQHIQLMETL